jgi:hypothetical protein
MENKIKKKILKNNRIYPINIITTIKQVPVLVHQPSIPPNPPSLVSQFQDPNTPYSNELNVF